MARPEIPLDEKKILELARRQWSTAEIAAFFEVSEDTLHRHFAGKIAKSRLAGSAKLKDLLWKKAVQKDGSERLLLHAVNRFVGPVPKDTGFDASKLSDDELAIIVAERLGVSLGSQAPRDLSDVFGSEKAEAPPRGPGGSEVRSAKEIRRESSAISGRTMLKKGRKK